MAGTTSRLFTRPFGTSTGYWRDGHIGSSNPYGAIGGAHISGWRMSSRDASLIAVRYTGDFC